MLGPPSPDMSNPTFESLSLWREELGGPRPICFFTTPATFKLVVGSAANTYYVHKTLLGSLSQEMYNHVYNDMKEGKEDTMILEKELEDTVEWFLEWIYMGCYGESCKGPRQLISHARLYAFADRFNLADLKTLAFTNIKTEVHGYSYSKMFCDPSEALFYVVQTALYAFENVPFTSQGDELLNLFVSEAAWALHAWRKCELFWELMKLEDFAFALIKILPEKTTR